MKLGLIARADARGLGHLSLELYRHLRPAKTLVVHMGTLARGFRQNVDWYPGATVVAFDGAELPEAEVRSWLEGLDVVYSAETFYDWQVCRWADQAGVASVCMTMPEFFRHHGQHHGLPEPTAWWAPTTWRLEHLPPETLVVPVPVATERWSDFPPPLHEGPLRVLHVAGHRTVGDRNGTRMLLQAMRSLKKPVHVTITGQDGRLPQTQPPRAVTVDYAPSGVDDYWDLYPGHDVLVLPRRYGGLCLPAQEAMGAGLALVMPDVEPNRDWPAVLVPCRPNGMIQAPAGPIPCVAANPLELARTIERLTDPAALHEAKKASREWALANSWEALTPVYQRALHAACAAREQTAKSDFSKTL